MNLKENINRVRQIMGLTTESKNEIHSLEYIKDKIADATSWKDFVLKNRKWGSMQQYINKNYKDDPENNWKKLISVFDDKKINKPTTKYSLEYIKDKIADATSWKDFVLKNRKWGSMQQYINKNYKDDPENNWKKLISHFPKK